MACPHRRWILGLAGIALGVGAAAAARPAPQTGQQPVFKSGVELIAVDVAVVDKNGNPIAGLRPDQFDVTIDGKPRRVVSADFLEYASQTKAERARRDIVPAAQPQFSSNEDPDSTPSQGRLIFLAIDQGSFKPLGAHGAMEAARRFIDRLQPTDRVGLIAFPPPGPSVGASRDHAAARAATAQIIGSAVPFSTRLSQRNVSLAEAIDIHAGDSMTMERVMTRECNWARSAIDRRTCEEDVRSEAVDIGRTAEIQANRSLAGIETIIRGLARIKERKTLVLISAGLPVADRMGMDLQLTGTVASLGRDAAAANLNMFVLHIDSGFLDAFSASERAFSDTLSRDLGIMSGGLETISGASGGSLARVVAGADFAFDRVLRETAAAYVVGVEPAATDRDGKTHRINVRVSVSGAEVRSRREVMIPVVDTKPATPEDALVSAFRSTRQTKDLRLRVATASMAVTSGGRHRVFVSADIGQGLVGPVEMRLLYAITESSGRTSTPVEQKQTLRPRPGDASGSVSFTFQDALRPGSYALRLAAVDSAGLAGSVDHTFTVGLAKGDGAQLSDLLLLEPGQSGQDQVDIIIDGRLRGDAADAYLEIVPDAPSAAKPVVTVGVADRPDAAPLVSVPALVSRTAGAEHWSAAARLNLTLLPPGDYVATAIVSAGERTLGRVTRPIHVDRAALAAGGTAAGVAPAPRVSFAAGESGSLVKGFSPQDVLGRDTIDYFAGRLRAASPAAAGTPETASAVAFLEEGKYDEAFAALAVADQTVLPTLFLRGLALLGKGELEPASVQFRASLDVAPDFLPAAFYLGACYAAGGHDREAVGAWQTALITESDARIIYDVLGDALLRLNDDEAALLLTEARDKWADDDRFVPRLAASEALRGRPRDAMALLDGYLTRHPEDANALLLALRLLYDARSAGRRIASAAADTASARRYADLYRAAGGSKTSLVDRWVAYIAGK